MSKPSTSSSNLKNMDLKNKNSVKLLHGLHSPSTSYRVLSKVVAWLFKPNCSCANCHSSCMEADTLFLCEKHNLSLESLEESSRDVSMTKSI